MSDQTTMETDGLWTADDVARFLKTSRSWVYHRAQAGRLPCLKIGGLLRFDPVAIRGLVAGDGLRPRKIVAL
jgi:hypothetical protein